MRGLYKKAQVTHKPSEVTHKGGAVTHAMPMTGAQKQKRWRQAHLDEYRARNRERMRAYRAAQKAGK